MEHQFTSQRGELAQVREKIRLLSDVATLLRMSADDHACMLRRRDRDVADDTVKSILIRRASTVGHLMDDFSSLRQPWTKFITAGGADVLQGSDFHRELEAQRRALTHRRDELSAVEDISSSSSYSDYSDSESSSTEDGEETDDDEREEASPPAMDKKPRPRLFSGIMIKKKG